MEAVVIPAAAELNLAAVLTANGPNDFVAKTTFTAVCITAAAEGAHVSTNLIVKSPTLLGVGGLKPNEDEYITMGMAAYGEPIYDLSELLSRNNHKGLGNYKPNAREEDLAASVQYLYEKELLNLVELCPKDNLILMGGCALNCVANS